MAMLQAVGAAFNMDEMFMNFPFDKLKLTCKQSKEINGNEHRDMLVKKIFRECVRLILNDVIDNNVTFELPTGSRKCDIHMKKVQDEEFKNLRKSGKWKDVDLLESNFTGYELGLFMYGYNRPPRTKTIYVNKDLKDKITKYTNEGKQYC